MRRKPKFVDILSYKVFNGLGKVVSSKAIHSSQNFQVQLNDQPKGIYLIEIDNGREKFHKKLIFQ
ncbi:MAG: T9SS type A sorting domain-containing protein [Bacteroidetes bacterium]|nr:T9SS type A sorting domain-containing protein [Bacteroidota bacterium]